jgi:hypothetical protein
LLILVVAPAVVLVVRARGPLVQTTLAVRRDLEQHLVASGRVRVVVELSRESWREKIDAERAKARRK